MLILLPYIKLSTNQIARKRSTHIQFLEKNARVSLWFFVRRGLKYKYIA